MSTTADTIHFTTSIDFLENMEKTMFSECVVKDTDSSLTRKHFLKQKSHGINRITIDERRAVVFVDVSSKILLRDYRQSISLNNLDHFIDRLNNSGIILNKDFVNEAKVIRVDVKNDITLDGNFNEIINSLNHLAAAKFSKTLYDTGIVFREKVKIYPSSLTLYGKEHEIKQNKEFYKNYPGLAEGFNNVLRVEGRLAKAGTIIKHIGSNDFMAVLKHSNLNYNMLNKVIAGQEFEKMFNINDMTAAEERNFARIYLLHNHYNGNFGKIEKHIKSKLGEKTKASSQMKEAKRYFSMIENSKDDFISQNIEMIKNALMEN